MHPNLQRVIAIAMAVVGVLASFAILQPAQATAICSLIAAVAVLWQPTPSQKA